MLNVWIVVKKLFLVCEIGGITLSQPPLCQSRSFRRKVLGAETRRQRWVWSGHVLDCALEGQPDKDSTQSKSHVKSITKQGMVKLHSRLCKAITRTSRSEEKRSLCSECALSTPQGCAFHWSAEAVTI